MKNYLEKLEYPKILNILSNYASTYLGKEKCLNLIPSNNIDTVKSTLSETEEALNILYRCNTTPISEIADNTKNLKAIESYSTLSIKSIFNVANTLSLVSAYKVRTICFKNGFKHVIVNLLFSTSCKIESILSSSRVSSLK